MAQSWSQWLKHYQYFKFLLLILTLSIKYSVINSVCENAISKINTCIENFCQIYFLLFLPRIFFQNYFASLKHEFYVTSRTKLIINVKWLRSFAFHPSTPLYLFDRCVPIHRQEMKWKQRPHFETMFCKKIKHKAMPWK